MEPLKGRSSTGIERGPEASREGRLNRPPPPPRWSRGHWKRIEPAHDGCQGRRRGDALRSDAAPRGRPMEAVAAATARARRGRGGVF